MARIAFLSTAHIHTKGFIQNVLNAADGRVVAAVWDDVVGRGRRYAEMANAPFVESLDAVLADSSIDGFVICAENTRHLPLLKKALPTGKPVFCEKPLVTTTADLVEVQALLARYPTTLFCGYFLPFEPAMLAAAELIKAGAFGKITRVRCRNAHHAAYGRWFDNPDLAWFCDSKLAGGGAFMDMGTHALHLVRTLFGPVKEVWAVIENHSGAYPACDDYGIAQLRFSSGVLGTVEAGWTQTGGIGGLEIVGSEKSLWNTGNGYVVGKPGGPCEQLVLPAAGKPTRMDRLVAAIRGQLSKEELGTDLTAAMDAVAIMEAAYRGGGWVKVVSGEEQNGGSKWAERARTQTLEMKNPPG